jgi:hypothetical protein
MLLAAVILGGCAAPAHDRDAYQHDALLAVQSALTETRTAYLAVDNLLSGKATRPYTDTVVTDTEDAIAPIQSSFGAVHPPGRSEDDLRDQVGNLLTDAGNALSAARVAVRRGDNFAMQQAQTTLTVVADQLDQAQENLE